MPNNTNYSFDEVVVYKETSENVMPTSPSALKVAGLINFNVKDTQKTETTATLSAGGQASKKDRGTSDFAGNMEVKMLGDVMPFIVTHVLGKTTKTDVTASDWADSTAYTKFDQYTLAGDIVNHSDGVHSLVCKVAGTSDSTEPDLTGKVSGDTVIDATVTWIVRKKLYKYTGQSDTCLETFGAEYKASSGCGGTTETFIKRFQGNFLNSYEIAKSNGTIIHKYSLPVVAMSAADNVVGNADGTEFVSVKDVSGYAEQDMNELPFGYDDVMVQVGGAELVNGRSFRMTVNRSVTVEDASARNTKVSNIPQMTVDGEIQLKFTKEQYLAAYENENTEVKAMFGKQNGDIAHFTFPSVEKDRVDPDFTTNEPAYLTIPLTADGDNVTATLSFVVYSEVNY